MWFLEVSYIYVWFLEVLLLNLPNLTEMFTMQLLLEV